MRIGNVSPKTPVFLAPMAGITDLAFREICAAFGAGIVYGEMVSAKAMTMKNPATMALLKTSETEGLSAAQIFGSDPAVIAEAAAMINETNFDILDINMGCPVPKVVKNREGSALARDPALVERIVRAAALASQKPVTVKIRKGIGGEYTAPEAAKAAEAGGAAAVAVHGRTREQYYSGKADWCAVRDVKAAVKIPVIGSGDIADPADVKRAFDETGCDAVMIGRAAHGNPWIFLRAAAFLETGAVPDEPEPGERAAAALSHLRRLIEEKGERAAVREMRGHLCAYIKGMRGAASARALINKSEAFSEMESVILGIISIYRAHTIC